MKPLGILVVAAALAATLAAPASAGFKQCRNKLMIMYCTDKGYSHCWDTAASAVCCSTDKSGEARDCSKPGVRVAMRDGYKVTMGRQ